MTSKRLFLAIPLGEAVKDGLADLQREICNVYGKRGCVHRDSLHLTLRFYGDVTDTRVPDLADELNGIFSNMDPFETAVHELGTFGRPDFPRVVVAGVKPDRDLQKMAVLAEEQARRFGFKAENRPFRAHITLHRPKQSGVLSPRTLGSPIPLQVDRIILMRSLLGPARAIYEPVSTIKLGEN